MGFVESFAAIVAAKVAEELVKELPGIVNHVSDSVVDSLGDFATDMSKSVVGELSELLQSLGAHWIDAVTDSLPVKNLDLGDLRGLNPFGKLFGG